MISPWPKSIELLWFKLSLVCLACCSSFIFKPFKYSLCFIFSSTNVLFLPCFLLSKYFMLLSITSSFLLSLPFIYSTFSGEAFDCFLEWLANLFFCDVVGLLYSCDLSFGWIINFLLEPFLDEELTSALSKDWSINESSRNLLSLDCCDSLIEIWGFWGLFS